MVEDRRWPAYVADAWLAGAPRRWWSAAVIAVGLAGLLVSFIGSLTVTCSPEQPCRRVDVESFGVFIGLIVWSFVGLWLWPRIGAVLGLAVAALDLAFDSAGIAHWVFGAFAGACLLLLEASRLAAETQRDAVGRLPRHRLTARERRPTSADLRSSTPLGQQTTIVWLCAIAAVVIGMLGAGRWAYVQHEDARHRAVAVEVIGVVTTEWNDNYRQTVAIDTPGLPRTVQIAGSSELPRQATVRVLVDPNDPSWVELPFDPPDHSGWLALAVLGLGFGLVAVAAEIRRRLLLRSTEGIAVEIRRSENGARMRDPAGNPLAEYRTAQWHSLTSAEQRSDAAWHPALLVGDPTHGGWSAVATDSGLMLPLRQLSAMLPAGVTARSAPAASAKPSDIPGFTRGARHRTQRAYTRALVRHLAVAVLALVFAAAAGLILFTGPWQVATGQGASGVITITTPSCERSCSTAGDYRSNDGRFAFANVDYTGSGSLGSVHPAIYVGSGERPLEVYAPGWDMAGLSGAAGVVALVFAFVRGRQAYQDWRQVGATPP